MNKTLLIILCDFLLLSLLSLARFDEGPPLDSQPPVAVSGAGEADLMEALSVALEEERLSRETLEAELVEAQDVAMSAAEALAERERRLAEFEKNLEVTAGRAEVLDEERRRIEAEVKAAQNALQDMRRQLTSTERQSEMSQSKLETLQSELLRRERDALLLRDKLDQVQEQQLSAEKEKQDLALQLRATDVERRLALEQLNLEREEKAKIQGQVQVLAEGVTTLSGEIRDGVTTLSERSGAIAQGVTALTERSGVIEQGVTHLAQQSATISEDVSTLQNRAVELSQGVTTLQERSEDLTREVRDYRPLTGNVIFNDFLANRLDVDFRAERSTFFGQRANARATRTVLVSDGSATYAIFHAQETLLNLAYGQTSWQSLWGSIRRDARGVTVDEVSFLRSDPRVALIRLSEEQAQTLGAEVYPLSKDPFRFGEAVLVGGGGDYFGEAPFHLDPDMPGYVRMERRGFRLLSGDFKPNRGDLVFSKSGEVLGIMVNREYCHVLVDLGIPDVLVLGDQVQAQRNREVLGRLGLRLGMLPQRIQ